MAIDVYLDRSELVGRAIGTVKTNLLEGALIVLFVLVLFLGNWRAGLVVASVIPLAMLFAIAMMRLFGVSGNLLSPRGHRLWPGRGRGRDYRRSHRAPPARRAAAGTGQPARRSAQMNEETYTAASKIRSSAAFGEIIILIVYLPLLALVGIEGKMFRPMAQTVAFAILGAFILSLTYVPMMSALALSRNTAHQPQLLRPHDALARSPLPPGAGVGPAPQGRGADQRRGPVCGRACCCFVPWAASSFPSCRKGTLPWRCARSRAPR